jgi:hypothetical protein
MNIKYPSNMEEALEYYLSLKDKKISLGEILVHFPYSVVYSTEQKKLYLLNREYKSLGTGFDIYVKYPEIGNVSKLFLYGSNDYLLETQEGINTYLSKVYTTLRNFKEKGYTLVSFK